MKRKTASTILLLIFWALLSMHASAQETFPLYQGEVPNSIPDGIPEESLSMDGRFMGYRSVSSPTLAVYLPPAGRATGAAVIICPGGGYFMVSYSEEGVSIAKAFVKQGVAAFVLKYRLPSDAIMIDKTIGPVQDAQQAIKTVRQRAGEWQIDPDKVGIMGFSAGGHLAATAGTHFKASYIPDGEKVNLRPDFMILVYPVISMTDDITHQGSKENLLGKDPSPELVERYSNEIQITADTPPTWITHASDDTLVPVANSIRFYEGLLRNNVSAEMHLIASGDHGFVLRKPADEWMIPLFEWMKSRQIILPE